MGVSAGCTVKPTRCQKLTATVIASGPITNTSTNATGSSINASRGRALRGTV